jgi:O-methyltransferase domain/Dimerisation domain
MTTQSPTMQPEVPPQQVMLQLISGFWISRGIYVAAKLGIPDLLASGPKSSQQLASATGTHARSLQRIMRALLSVGVFAEGPNGSFALNPISETLCTNVPGSVRWFAISELGEEHYPAWGDLMHSVKTGGIAFDHTFGMDIWEFFRTHPENAELFNNSMSMMTAMANEEILKNYDFSSIEKIVDVGGGHGGLITSILKANPSMCGVLFDAESVVKGARGKLDAAGLAERCETVAGDFFNAVPEGGHAYIMKWIIHDWDDERATTILKNCRKAMKPEGRVLVVDVVIPQSNEPHFGKFIDLNMLVMTGGLERTEEEFRQLLEASGLRLTRVVPTQTPFSIVESVPL